MLSINVIKGFTVPPGYTLLIYQDDGEVLEKTAGQQSGGNYSFEQVLEGVDQSWELIGSEVQQQEEPEVEAEAPPEPTAPKIKKPIEKPTIDKDKLLDRDFSDFDDETKEILDGVSDNFLYELIRGGGEISVSTLMGHPKLDYVSQENANEEIAQAAVKIEEHGDDSIVAFSLAGSMYKGFSSRAKRTVGSLDKFLTQVAQTRYGKDVFVGRDKVEEYDDNIPSLEGTKVVTALRVNNILESYKNPVNVRRIFASYDRDSLVKKVNAIEDQADKIAEELEGEQAISEEYDNAELITTLSSNLDKLRDEAEKVFNGGFTDGFRKAIVSSLDSEWEEIFEVSEKELLGQGFSKKQLNALKFAAAFFHPSLKTNTDSFISVEKIGSGERAYAEGTIIHITPEDEPKTFAHEFAHTVEYLFDGLAGLNSMQFLCRRIGLDEKTVAVGEENLEGSSQEVGFKDRFPDEYIGRVYLPLGKEAEIGKTFREVLSGEDSWVLTEVVSMGLEMMFENPLKMAQEEPDFFEFMWSLRTSPRMVKRNDNS